MSVERLAEIMTGAAASIRSPLSVVMKTLSVGITNDSNTLWMQKTVFLPPLVLLETPFLSCLKICSVGNTVSSFADFQQALNAS